MGRLAKTWTRLLEVIQQTKQRVTGPMDHGSKALLSPRSIQGPNAAPNVKPVGALSETREYNEYNLVLMCFRFRHNFVNQAHPYESYELERKRGM